MITRVYSEGDTLAHLTSDAEGRALCGKKPWPNRWRGDIYDKQAYVLTLCLGCAQRVKDQR